MKRSVCLVVVIMSDRRSSLRSDTKDSSTAE